MSWFFQLLYPPALFAIFLISSHRDWWQGSLHTWSAMSVFKVSPQTTAFHCPSLLALKKHLVSLLPQLYRREYSQLLAMLEWRKGPLQNSKRIFEYDRYLKNTEVYISKQDDHVSLNRKHNNANSSFKNFYNFPFFYNYRFMIWFAAFFSFSTQNNNHPSLMSWTFNAPPCFFLPICRIQRVHYFSWLKQKEWFHHVSTLYPWVKVKPL